MSIYVYNGIPGSGKSLKLADIAMEKLERNKRYYYKTLKKTGVGVQRVLYSNMKFLPHIEEKYQGFLGYWEDPAMLVKLRDCDIIFDEIATYLDSTQWANVSLEFKRWLQLHRHYGIDIYGSTQDFPMIDISMRRLVKGAYIVNKLLGSRDKSATRPAVKNPWGICLIRQIDPDSYDKPRSEYKFMSIIPEILIIDKQKCNTFDTTQELRAGKYPPLRHIARECEDPNCQFHKVIHV